MAMSPITISTTLRGLVSSSGVSGTQSIGWRSAAGLSGFEPGRHTSKKSSTPPPLWPELGGSRSVRLT